MKLIELINPMRLADQLGPYYIPALFGAGLLVFVIGGSCG